MSVYSAYETQPIPIKVFKVVDDGTVNFTEQTTAATKFYNPATDVYLVYEGGITDWDKYQIGDTIIISGATYNNGTYTIVSSSSNQIQITNATINSTWVNNSNPGDSNTITLETPDIQVNNGQVLEFVDVVTNYRSYSFKRSLSGIGTFSIEINGDFEKSAVLQQGYVIQIGNDRKKQGQIEKRELSLTAKKGVGENIVKVSGPQIKHILMGSLIVPPAEENTFPEETVFTYNGTGDIDFGVVQSHQNYKYNVTTYPITVAYILYDLVRKTRTNYDDGTNLYPVISSQKIINFRIDTFAIDAALDNTNFNEGTEVDNTSNIDYNFRYKELTEVLTELCDLEEIGWDVYYDFSTNEWVFELVQGVDRTRNQTDNDWAIFSFNRGNIRSAKYVEDFTTYKSEVVVAGSNDEAARRMFYKKRDLTEIGIYSKVAFRDARDVKSDNADYDETEVITARADEELEKTLYKQTLDIQGFVGKSTIVLDTDYTIGDFVSIDVEDWGITGSGALNLQVTAITEKQMNGSIGEIDITFGKATNTISSLLRNKLNKYSLTVTN